MSQQIPQWHDVRLDTSGVAQLGQLANQSFSNVDNIIDRMNKERIQQEQFDREQAFKNMELAEKTRQFGITNQLDRDKLAQDLLTKQMDDATKRWEVEQNHKNGIALAQLNHNLEMQKLQQARAWNKQDNEALSKILYRASGQELHDITEKVENEKSAHPDIVNFRNFAANVGKSIDETNTHINDLNSYRESLKWTPNQQKQLETLRSRLLNAERFEGSSSVEDMMYSGNSFSSGASGEDINQLRSNIRQLEEQRARSVMLNPDNTVNRDASNPDALATLDILDKSIQSEQNKKRSIASEYSSLQERSDKASKEIDNNYAKALKNANPGVGLVNRYYTENYLRTQQGLNPLDLNQSINAQLANTAATGQVNLERDSRKAEQQRLEKQYELASKLSSTAQSIGDLIANRHKNSTMDSDTKQLLSTFGNELSSAAKRFGINTTQSKIAAALDTILLTDDWINIRGSDTRRFKKSYYDFGLGSGQSEDTAKAVLQRIKELHRKEDIGKLDENNIIDRLTKEILSSI